jgi:hypothetical protein
MSKSDLYSLFSAVVSFFKEDISSCLLIVFLAGQKIRCKISFTIRLGNENYIFFDIMSYLV